MANKNIEHLNNATNEERNPATLKIMPESRDVIEKMSSTDHSDAPMEVDETTLLNKSSQSEEPKSQHHGKLWRIFACPPQGIIASVLTKVIMVILLWAVVWSITGPECLPGGNLFGNLILFVCAVLGGKIVGMIKFPNLPPLPGLLGMLLAGFILRNIPVVSDAIYIDYKWSSSLRSIALAIILTRAGLGLDAKALRKLKAVCLRLAFGPCLSESCVCAVLGHYLLHLPWSWSFILGFVMGAVSPAVVVPCMLMLQKDLYGVDKGIPTLLMAAGSFDDILAITGFNTCLGIAFSSGLGIATLSIALVVRILVTFLMVHFSGFNIKERIFISLAWIPKATVQAAIGSVALDMARIRNDKTATDYGLSVLTVAFLGILITAPIGAVIIGLLGPKLLHKSNQQDSNHGEGIESKNRTSHEHHQGVESEIEV
ncbi:sodium/hydrogen exchanger 9B2-like [Rhincodon typus]|uniref:sodium/hydrogen exchanger 9B2-like n=1 Tax=Rhincodon typus TaxID=259920 RepID=UPI00202DCEC3|nr:sodium/hydrogen exchanger 9B2-like [Rhincodon typus]